MEVNESANEQAAQDPAVSKPTRVISGFWRRLLAFLIDGAALGVVGLVVGSIFFRVFSELGVWGRLVGFSISLLYFGIGNSSLTGGQTLGKRLLNIKVVGKDAGPISLPRSCSRFMILGPPYFLNGAAFSPDVLGHPVISFLLVFIVFAMGASVIYLFVFNRKTRQSLHDLVVGTTVVMADPPPGWRAPAIWKGHLATVCILVAAVVFGTVMVVPKLVDNEFFGDLTAVQESIHETGLVHVATVSVGKSFGSRKGADGVEKWETTYFSTNAVLKDKPQHYEAVFNQIASVILDRFPDAGDKDLLIINLTYGYDIGIASSWVRRTQRCAPRQWRMRLMKAEDTIET